jgi:hypothetical protein
MRRFHKHHLFAEKPLAQCVKKMMDQSSVRPSWFQLMANCREITAQNPEFAGIQSIWHSSRSLPNCFNILLMGFELFLISAFMPLLTRFLDGQPMSLRTEQDGDFSRLAGWSGVLFYQPKFRFLPEAGRGGTEFFGAKCRRRGERQSQYCRGHFQGRARQLTSPAFGRVTLQPRCGHG